MKLITLTTPICLLALLAVSSCGLSGSFCDLAERLETDEATARYILAHDRALVIEMNVQNRLLDRCR